MKKFIAILLVAAALILCLAGCAGKKATAVVAFDNVDSVTALPVPGMKNIGVQVQDTVMTVNMGNEGVYTFPIVVDGTAYDFTLTNENGKITVEAVEGLSFTIK